MNLIYTNTLFLKSSDISCYFFCLLNLSLSTLKLKVVETFHLTVDRLIKCKVSESQKRTLSEYPNYTPNLFFCTFDGSCHGPRFYNRREKVRNMKYKIYLYLVSDSTSFIQLYVKSSPSVDE